MEATTGEMQLDGQDQGSLEMVQSMGSGIADLFHCGQLEPMVFTAGPLSVVSPPGPGIPQQSLGFNFDTTAFGIDLMMLPPPSNFGPLMNDIFPLNPDSQYSFPPPSDRANLCPRGHDHAPWPKKGLLRIQKCERTCHFCGLKLKTAAALRKHVNDHKYKDGLDIEIARSSSGPPRRALLVDNGFGVLEQPKVASRSLTHVIDEKNGPNPQEVADGGHEHQPTDFIDALLLVGRLRKENAQLKAENEVLMTELGGLRKETKRGITERPEDQTASGDAGTEVTGRCESLMSSGPRPAAGTIGYCMVSYCGSSSGRMGRAVSCGSMEYSSSSGRNYNSMVWWSRESFVAILSQWFVDYAWRVTWRTATCWRCQNRTFRVD